MPAPRPRKKGLIVTLIIIAILVVLGGAAALAYKFWYQNPEKVVTDGLLNALKADTVSFKAVADVKSSSSGTITMTGSITKKAASADFEFVSTSDDMDYAIKGSGMYAENGDYYLKVTNVRELVDMLMSPQSPGEMPAGVTSALNNFVTKVNDQWIKISASDIEKLGAEGVKSQTCLQDVYKKLETDKSYTNELGDLYEQHRFIVITRELGSKDGSLGYEVDTDIAKMKDFARGLKDTKLYKDLHGCDNSFAINENDISEESSGAKTTMEVWVSRWTHEITKVNLVNEEGNERASVVLETTFNRPITITEPTQSKSVEDVMKDFETLQTEIMREYMNQAGVEEGAGLSTTGV